MKQSSIEWLKNKLEEYGDPQCLEITWEELDDLIKHSQEIHRVEIVEAYANGSNDRLRSRINEQYYNETFNTKEK